MPNYNKTFLIPNVRGEEEKIKLVIINQKNYPNKFVAHFDEILYFSPNKLDNKNKLGIFTQLFSDSIKLNRKKVIMFKIYIEG